MIIKLKSNFNYFHSYFNKSKAKKFILLVMKNFLLF